MATIAAAPSASIKQSSSVILSNQYPSLPVAQPFRFTTAHRHTLSYSTSPKSPMAISEKAPAANSSTPKAPPKPIIVIDNYDSFTYNLCQYMGELGCDFEVYRNDELTVDELREKNPRGILISPGPGTPQDSGISLQTVLDLGPTVPLFGVCMGLQCIGEAFGGKIVRSPSGVVHGKSSPVYYNEGGEDGLFAGLSNPFTAGRYHSLVIERDSFPNDALEITAWTEDGLVMAARHKVYRHIQGVQFHPESIISTEGKTIVHNFIKLIKRKEAESQKQD
ncbi:anthranilate synthase beta subunit 1, chloroplastic-like [Salvia hispanica]|uniref:anthranilate synthase beta subunit 1, chloroplastic-like n=1 Tax=Salvia hispanica TaxID=49212 RepID=UPI00200955CE|nr:anthranilate synthase beta subunit 1, chloroplastic-like [Salvia hispanica]